ncbi:White collar 1 protein [Tolypocladium ophioglossoides CBS 100239]|uniref:White collar 1 protein n=1 Tax=Tolypocladium ophioglossoides (strain CBS 100239) TaxID=1163406 RepID=A0A0L0N936_TOLOC|nr:White collar 1 protein [Tolypocladium ophioglossoides CBS 100239]
MAALRWAAHPLPRGNMATLQGAPGHWGHWGPGLLGPRPASSPFHDDHQAGRALVGKPSDLESRYAIVSAQKCRFEPAPQVHVLAPSLPPPSILARYVITGDVFLAMVSKGPPALNPWEMQALDYQFPSQLMTEPEGSPRSEWRQLEDPVMYPGLYSTSGYDMMDILQLRVTGRPNPQIELGAVDCSVALTLCDLNLPDQPIVYASDSFCELTGYSKAEVLGRNCRFLQSPGGAMATAAKSGSGTDKAAVHRMRLAVHARKEIQLKLTNFKKNGQRFKNVVSIVPIDLDTTGSHYAVGFHVEAN